MVGAMIAAPGSGDSKTMVAYDLLTLSKKKGYSPAIFKCGPDYIDGLFHRRVLGVENGDLDNFFETGTHMRQKLSRNVRDHLMVAEGAMGYFDGLESMSLRESSFETGSILGLPTILVMDGGGASLSLMASIQGFSKCGMTANAKNEKKFREKKTCEKRARNIRGIFFSRISSMIYSRLEPMVEEWFQIPVMGYLPELKFLQVRSRHLGLMLPGKVDGIRGQLEQLADQMDDSLEWGSLLRAAADMGGCGREAPARPGARTASHFRLGITRDEAFCSYYEDNLRAIEQAGAELVYLSPLHRKELSEKLGGLTLEGGYPENHGEALAVSAAIQGSAAAVAGSGMPALAECGGYLYLLGRLGGADGTNYPVAGVLRGHGHRVGETGRLGYITLQLNRSLPFLQEGAEIKDHEFHYWNYGYGGDEFYMTAIKPNGSRYRSCMRTVERVMTGFPHLYYPSCPELVQSFAGQCMIYGKGHEL